VFVILSEAEGSPQNIGEQQIVIVSIDHRHLERSREIQKNKKQHPKKLKTKLPKLSLARGKNHD